MTVKITFAAGGSEATITGVERAAVADDSLRCYTGPAGEGELLTEIPLGALQSIQSAESSGDGSSKGSSGDGSDVEPTARVTADPSDPGAGATHTVSFQVADAVDDFSYFRVDYAAVDAHTSVNDIEEDNIVRFGVDTNDDGVIEKSIATGDWSVSHGGSGYTLRVRNEDWAGTIESGDEIVLEFDGVTNPEAPGTYAVEVVLNGHQNARGEYTVGAGAPGSD